MNFLLISISVLPISAYRTPPFASLLELDRNASQADPLPSGWRKVCEGYVTEVEGTREGLGAASRTFLGMEVCLQACNEKDRCNFVTYDVLNGKCWMETVRGKPTQCDKNLAGTSYLHVSRDFASEDAPSALPLGWHFFCNGYLQDKEGRTGFGATPERHMGETACLEACRKQGVCNLVTYDTLRGICWMEHLVRGPRKCDSNDAGHTYWYHNDDEIWELQGFYAMNGWHFVCHGYLSGVHSGRKYIGPAGKGNLGQEGCKAACDAKEGCNFVTYDSWRGICWMESLDKMPDSCDHNVAGWSYWRETSAVDSSDSVHSPQSKPQQNAEYNFDLEDMDLDDWY